jgi:predicted nucleotidyltransferase
MEKVIRERAELREKAVKEALEFSRCASEKLGRLTAILFGSYARGDFNEWSDIDVLVIAERLPPTPLRRLDLVEECLELAPRVEPVIISVEEFHRLKGRNPALLEALQSGVPLLDQLGLLEDG